MTGTANAILGSTPRSAASSGGEFSVYMLHIMIHSICIQDGPKERARSGSRGNVPFLPGMSGNGVGPAGFVSAASRGEPTRRLGPSAAGFVNGNCEGPAGFVSPPSLAWPNSSHCVTRLRIIPRGVVRRGGVCVDPRKDDARIGIRWSQAWKLRT